MPEELTIAVRALVPDEAESLVDLLRRCYGDTYIDPTFYDPQAVHERLTSRTLHSIGAWTTDALLVGHMAIAVRPWGGNTADAGMTLVAPSHRGEGIARKVAVGLAKQAIALGLVGVHDYPVTVHAATQRLGKGYGIDTGLMLANLPADVSFQAMDNRAAHQRTSSVVRWLPVGSAPAREVYLPARYRPRIESLYDEARLRRTPLTEPKAPTERPSRVEVSLDERRRTARFRVTQIGADLATCIGAATDDAHRKGALIAHVDLPLSDAGTTWAPGALCGLGYSFSALLPEYRNGDVLRLQWLSEEATASAPSVLSSEALRSMASYVLEDRAEVLAAMPSRL